MSIPTSPTPAPLAAIRALGEAIEQTRSAQQKYVVQAFTLGISREDVASAIAGHALTDPEQVAEALRTVGLF